uniref:C2H2-type domain-containing protein n=1 Tax=Cajanus cajan TaxID=3821 RepID=A0A151TLI8_CAJCA|nr:hypothetical protein KK1_021536 [Cajanus cajan]
MKADLEEVTPKPNSLPAEEAARSLLMLSKNKWPESKEIKNQEVKEMRAKDKDGRDDLLVQIPSQANFKCDKYGKIFQSHQALGGHKANHKKNDDVGEKVFEYPYCSKVFKSVRPLGGHKKVHFSYNKANAQSSANQFGRKLVINLNFPAPIED